jgi:hypothetical protein
MKRECELRIKQKVRKRKEKELERKFDHFITDAASINLLAGEGEACLGQALRHLKSGES